MGIKQYWVIIHKATGRAALKTQNSMTIASLNRDVFKAISFSDYQFNVNAGLAINNIFSYLFSASKAED